MTARMFPKKHYDTVLAKIHLYSKSYSKRNKGVPIFGNTVYSQIVSNVSAKKASDIRGR